MIPVSSPRSPTLSIEVDLKVVALARDRSQPQRTLLEAQSRLGKTFVEPSSQRSGEGF